MKRRAARCVVATALLLGGCADAGQPGHTFDVVEEDGVQVALNPAVPLYDGELFSYGKVVEIRPDPAVDDSYLYDPFALTVDDEDLVYVAEQAPAPRLPRSVSLTVHWTRC